MPNSPLSPSSPDISPRQYLFSKSSPDISTNLPVSLSSRSVSSKIAENTPKTPENTPKNSENPLKVSELKISDVWRNSETITPRPHRSPESSLGSRKNSSHGISPRSRKNSPPISPRSRTGLSPRKNSNSSVSKKESPTLPHSGQSPSRKYSPQNNKTIGNSCETSPKKDLAKLFTRPFSKSLSKSKEKTAIVAPLNIPQRTVTYNLEIKKEIIPENISEKDRNSMSQWYACHIPESELNEYHVFQRELQEQEEKMSPMLPSSGGEKRSPRSLRRRSSAPAMPGSGNISFHRGSCKENETL